MKLLISVPLITIFLLISNLFGQIFEEHVELLNKEDLNVCSNEISSLEINMSQKYLFTKNSILTKISSAKYKPQYIIILMILQVICYPYFKKHGIMPG